MGYNSKVRIGTTSEGYKFFKEYMESKIRVDGQTNNYLDDCEAFARSKGVIFFGWNWINFNEKVLEVKIIKEALEIMKDRNIPYKMIIVGEDYAEFGSIERTEYDEEDMIPDMYTEIDVVYDLD